MARNPLQVRQSLIRLCAFVTVSGAAVVAGQVLRPEIERTPRIRSLALRPRVLDFAPREDRVLIGDANGVVWLQEGEGEAGRRVRVGRIGPRSRLALSADGKLVAALGQDGKVSLVDAETGATQRTFRADISQTPVAVSLSSEDRRVTLVAERSGVLTWQRYRPSGAPVIRRLPLQAPLALSDAGSHVVGTEDGRLVLWNAESQQIEREFEDSREAFAALAISPNGRLLAAATESQPARIMVWDVSSGRVIRTLSSPVARIARLRFHRDEPRLGILDARGEVATVGVFPPMAAMRLPLRNAAPQSPRPPEAEVAGAPEAPGPEARHLRLEGEPNEPYITVPVYYGTNRLPRSQEDSAWAYQFREFFITTTAFVLYAVCFIVPLLVALVFNPRRRVTFGVLVGSILLLFALASVYATVRTRDVAERPGEYYGFRSGPLEYGRCEVTVPKVRELGVLNSPPSVWVFRAPENVAEHIILQTVTPYENADSFAADLQGHTVTKGEDELLVYIHGYNTTFEDAARRAAQLAVDLEMTGPPVFFSWPSHGNAARYTFDETNALAADPYLREFLETLVRKCRAKKIHVLAHSMGNVVLADALRDLTRSLSREERAVLNEVVLAAPDIDQRVFLQEVAPVIAPNHDVTLYVSSKDVALQTSREVHAYQRAGEAAPEITLFEGIDTIDASFVDTSKLGHSYYSEQLAVLEDLSKLLAGEPPGSRGLERLEDGGRTYWRLVKERLMPAGNP